MAYFEFLLILHLYHSLFISYTCFCFFLFFVSNNSAPLHPLYLWDILMICMCMCICIYVHILMTGMFYQYISPRSYKKSLQETPEEGTEFLFLSETCWAPLYHACGCFPLPVYTFAWFRYFVCIVHYFYNHVLYILIKYFFLLLFLGIPHTNYNI